MSDFAVYTILIVSVVILFFAVYTVVRAKSTIRQMNTMLDDAINGKQTVKLYDESEVSKLTLKLSQYLSHGRTSFKNVEIDRDNINSMVSDISHQTKTPISNILMYSDLLSESENLTEDDKKLVTEINSQSSKLSFLIQSLVDASRLETGILQVNPTGNFVSELIDTAWGGLWEKANSKGINIAAENVKGRAIFDMKWTVEAIGNILDNALKYSPEDSEIRITSTPYEQFVKIDISDSGIGISEDEYGKIYGRFYRSQAVSEREGVGIGLYITKEIIAIQNGYIKLDSTVDRGSTFSVFLPREH